MVYVIQVCWQLASKLSTNLYDIYHCCVYSDDGHRNGPKRVEFYSKNKFEKLVHLVGFIRRIYPQEGETLWDAGIAFAADG